MTAAIEFVKDVAELVWFSACAIVGFGFLVSATRGAIRRSKGSLTVTVEENEKETVQ